MTYLRFAHVDTPSLGTGAGTATCATANDSLNRTVSGMLRVTIEVVPFGDETKAYQIEEMVIANTGESEMDAYAHSYEYALADSKGRHPIVYGDVPNHRRAYGAWELVRTILNQRVFSDNPTTDTMNLLKERLNSDNTK